MVVLEIESFGIKIDDADQAVLRKLAEEAADLADLPVQKETVALWKGVNDLKPARRPPLLPAWLSAPFFWPASRPQVCAGLLGSLF